MEIAPKNNSLADENIFHINGNMQQSSTISVASSFDLFNLEWHLINHDCHQAAATAFRLRAALDDIGVAQNKNENPSIRWAIANCPIHIARDVSSLTQQQLMWCQSDLTDGSFECQSNKLQTSYVFVQLKIRPALRILLTMVHCGLSCKHTVHAMLLPCANHGWRTPDRKKKLLGFKWASHHIKPMGSFVTDKSSNLVEGAQSMLKCTPGASDVPLWIASTQSGRTNEGFDLQKWHDVRFNTYHWFCQSRMTHAAAWQASHLVRNWLRASKKAFTPTRFVVVLLCTCKLLLLVRTIISRSHSANSKSN